jgi:eukaryotic-like serine/threonine-protein kinase
MTHTSISSETLTAFRSELAEKYRLERELGQGGMATVYLAYDVANDRHVALKVLNPELAASLGAERFLREIEVGRTLLHPNIVGVLDSGSADGKLFYTMPFVEGASLRDKLDREKQLGIEEAIDLTKQIAEALAFAHSKGVIHRDIKPENILLSKGQALVADFGIARAVSVAGGERLTRTGMAVGTPTYMSPEQAMGSKDVTPESDIYSLACMVYEMLAGQPPFTGPTAMALLARHSLDNVPSLKIVRGTVPDAVEDAIVRAMAKVPADRFRSAIDFANALTDNEGARRRRANSMKNVAIPAGTMADVRVAGGSRKKLLIGALVAVPLLAAGGWFVWKKAGGGAKADSALAAMEAKNIAVLYFDDRSEGHALRYLSDGLTEALIHELGTVKALHVTSRNGVLPYKGKDVTTDSIAKALSVGTIVSGTVAQSGDKVRVQVEMLDARTGSSIGSMSIEKTKQDAFALQDTLVAEVSAALRKQIGQQVGVLTSRASTKNAAAWEAFQRAKQTVAQGDSLLVTGDVTGAMTALSRADSAFGLVAQQDDKWAAPISQQAILKYRLARLSVGAPVATISPMIDAGLERASKALALAPTDPDALEARGTLRYLQWLLNLTPPGQSDKAMAEVESDLSASIKANPAQASAMNVLSHLQIVEGRTSEGKLTAVDAYKADPYLTDANKTVWRLYQASNDLDQTTEAKKWCDEGARRFPNDYRFYECRLWMFMLRGLQPPPTADQIWKAYDEFIEVDKVDQPEFAKKKGLMLAAMGLNRAGLADSARSVIGRAQGDDNVDPTGDLAYLEAMARAQLGDKDKAISLLSRYYAKNPQRKAFIDRDEAWYFQSLFNEPRYKSLVGTR